MPLIDVALLLSADTAAVKVGTLSWSSNSVTAVTARVNISPGKSYQGIDHAADCACHIQASQVSQQQR